MKYITISLPAHTADITGESLLRAEFKFSLNAYSEEPGSILADTFKTLAAQTNKARNILDNAIENGTRSDYTISARIYINDIDALDTGLIECSKYLDAITESFASYMETYETETVRAQCANDIALAANIRLIANTVLDAVAEAITDAGINPFTLLEVA